MVRALLKYHSNALEEPKVNDMDVGGTVGSVFIETLRGFQLLKTIKLDMASLVRPADESSDDVLMEEADVITSKFVEFLPASTTIFKLDAAKRSAHGGASNHNLPDLENMFEGFVGRHAEALPNLQQLCLRSKNADMNRLWAQMG